MRPGVLGGLIMLAVLMATLPASAEGDSPAAQVAARRFVADHELAIIGDFRTLLALPNVATESADMQANAAWIGAYLARRGFAVETVSAGGAPYLLAERESAGATRTVLIYAHFDGQPVAPAEWASPPFEPTLRSAPVEAGGQVLDWNDHRVFNPEWRIVARSAGDDKAPIIALMAAVDALAAAGIEPGVNVKLILDGEEEAGSPTLERILARHAGALDADLMLFCDGPMHQSRRRQLVFGVRGSMQVDLMTYGANRPLHSGHYGNWAPNPTDDLIRLLAGLKDPEGRVVVAGFHRDVRPLSETERAALEALPAMEQALRNELSLGRTEGGDARLEALMMEPALVTIGLQAGAVGDQAKNVIRPTASAALNIRLVPDQTPARMLAALTKHFVSLGYHVVSAEPSTGELARHARVLKIEDRGGYPGFRTALDDPEVQRLTALLNELDDQTTLLTPMLGGSLPIYLFEQALDVPIVVLPIANHDNNQHGPNENLRIRNLWDAIEIYALVLAAFGDRDDAAG